MQHSDSPAVPADVWNWFGVLPSVDKNPSFACADDTDDKILEQETDVLSDFRISSNFLLRSFTSDSISWTSVIPIGSDILWLVDDDNTRHRSKESICSFLSADGGIHFRNNNNDNASWSIVVGWLVGWLVCFSLVGRFRWMLLPPNNRSDELVADRICSQQRSL
eukprot:CAMPEP_0113469220 /NCGR_PEP_ID=MMETSP0014_2-20120614/15781_1 /TAXON_ID=2857 /ORGANISM="Nitzschia sp." /LENGTH=163 /DNA_ID=CAMNT_0000361679 /DNA_START=734 /DNA_END=1225 /DNA_ORIENTATION=- /assembly_acc=CAM_ASM_000159